MVSRRPLPANRKGRLLDGGAVVAVAEARSGGGAAVARGGGPGGILACIFEVARKISGGVCGGVAAGFAADRARILCTGGDGAARPIGKAVGRVFWAWIGVYVWRAGSGVGALQLAVHGPAINRRV